MHSLLGIPYQNRANNFGQHHQTIRDQTAWTNTKQNDKKKREYQIDRFIMLDGMQDTSSLNKSSSVCGNKKPHRMSAIACLRTRFKWPKVNIRPLIKMNSIAIDWIRNDTQNSSTLFLPSFDFICGIFKLIFFQSVVVPFFSSFGFCLPIAFCLPFVFCRWTSIYLENL